MELLSIVVPCYNEEQAVELFYPELVKVLDTMDVDREIIFVNDGSTDRTLEKILALRDAHPGEVRCIDFSRNFGKESAMLAGLRMAKGDYVTVMDSDLQDPPANLPVMLKMIRENGDDVVGTRRVTRAGEPKIRSWFARQFYRLINHFTEVEIVDGARDFRVMKRYVVDSVLSLEEYNRFSKGMFAWVGYQVEYLEYENVERVAGETKWSFFKLVRYALDGFIEYTEAPMHIIGRTGGVMSFLMLIEMIVLLVRALSGHTVSGTVLILSCVLFMGSILMLALGIMAEYLLKTYAEVRKRPHYIVKNYYE
ncbi:MAG: glycosyltransferase family 2 protein [Solobacterium sp.]|nr:glycosyltransferase family 2 protein [Solobacterium sp.]MBR0478570.1 glycosyltransferase family 2 protein [Solobacterium sp.]